MTTADQKVEEAANRLQGLADRMSREGGLKAKLAAPLSEDADLIRKMKPSLIKARAAGNTPPADKRAAPAAPQLGPRPKRKRTGGPNPWLVLGAALATGIVVAKWIDWRGHAHPRV
jgi:hypothetical protein